MRTIIMRTNVSTLIPGNEMSEVIEREVDQGRNRPRRIRSEELLRGAREILIEHKDGEYRLRETRNGKLILTK
ncbi:MAG: hemin uptake protein HemP [Gammaproteobacteria bacterium]